MFVHMYRIPYIGGGEGLQSTLQKRTEFRVSTYRIIYKKRKNYVQCMYSGITVQGKEFPLQMGYEVT
jgi:hypothetical protein